jgi:hypothetical protein
MLLMFSTASCGAKPKPCPAVATPPPRIIVVQSDDPLCDLSKFPMPDPIQSVSDVSIDELAKEVKIPGWWWRQMVDNIARREARRVKLEECEQLRIARAKAKINIKSKIIP